MSSKIREMEQWTEAQRRQLLESVARLPYAPGVAMRLSPAAFRALVDAEKTRTGEFRLIDGVRHTAAGAELFRAGLVEARGPYLGNFGALVREEAMAMVAKGERK